MRMPSVCIALIGHDEYDVKDGGEDDAGQKDNHE